MKDWRSIALVALVSLLLGRESSNSQPNDKASSSPQIDPRNPVTVRIAGTVPVILVTPQPQPQPPDPILPVPVNPVIPPDTQLSRTARKYVRAVQTELQGLWNDMADSIERGEITDKAAAVKFHSRLSGELNAALDQVFSAGMDSRGKIVNPAAIVTPLRQSAAALGRSD
jgi:hypothetical protein